MNGRRAFGLGKGLDRYGWLTLVLLLVGAGSGCSSRPVEVEPVVGASASEMLQAPRSPVVLWRVVPGFGTGARDFLYLAPLDTNISGKRQFYLWFGLASTIDAARRPFAYTDLAAVTLLVDGATLELPLEPYVPTRRDLLEMPLQPLVDYRALVSAQQLRQIATPGPIRIISASTGGDDASFEWWAGERSSWAGLPAENSLQIRASAHEAPLGGPLDLQVAKPPATQAK